MPSKNLLRLAICSALLSTSTTYVFASSDDEKSSDSYSSSSSYSSSWDSKDDDGYDKDGYDRKGYDKKGYDKKGFDKDGYDDEGCDKDGYKRDGYDKDGYDRKGYDKKGYDKKGFDKDGYDDEGCDKDGYKRDGYDKDGYDRKGYDKEGYDKDGKDRDGKSKTPDTDDKVKTPDTGDDSCSSDKTSGTSVCDSWQGTYNYDMYDGNENIDYGLDGSLSSVSVDGVGIAVSTWSDTEKSGGNWLWGYDYDGVKKQNNLSRYSDGYGLVNDHESSSDYTQHTLDNRGNDFDMILLSFDQAVSLSGATFSYAENYGNNQQVTVVGLNNIDTFTGTDTFTWNTIADQVSSLGSSYSATFNIEQCDDTYVSEFTNLTGSAQYWLVGAYNTAFGYIDDFTAGDDSFKLASVGFTTTNAQTTGEASEVSTPATLGIFSIAAGLLMWRRKKAEAAK